MLRNIDRKVCMSVCLDKAWGHVEVSWRRSILFREKQNCEVQLCYGTLELNWKLQFFLSPPKIQISFSLSFVGTKKIVTFNLPLECCRIIDLHNFPRPENKFELQQPTSTCPRVLSEPIYNFLMLILLFRKYLNIPSGLGYFVINSIVLWWL